GTEPGHPAGAAGSDPKASRPSPGALAGSESLPTVAMTLPDGNAEPLPTVAMTLPDGGGSSSGSTPAAEAPDATVAYSPGGPSMGVPHALRPPGSLGEGPSRGPGRGPSGAFRVGPLDGASADPSGGLVHRGLQRTVAANTVDGL